VAIVKVEGANFSGLLAAENNKQHKRDNYGEKESMDMSNYVNEKGKYKDKGKGMVYGINQLTLGDDEEDDGFDMMNFGRFVDEEDDIIE